MMLKKFIFLALSISFFLVIAVKNNDDSGENDYDAFGEHLGESVVKSNDNSGEDDDDEHLGESATEIVVDFLSKFATLSSTTADVGSFMDRISLSTFALPKLAFPVGSLIAGALNISTKTKSEEYQALMKLHDTMEVKFEEISRTIAVATKVIARESNLNEYINV
uniref:SERPIN domain-containing protein n=1 Tax=Globodera pallida TaxID=36090 RepID=A0A183BP97_GLOPA